MKLRSLLLVTALLAIPAPGAAQEPPPSAPGPVLAVPGGDELTVRVTAVATAENVIGSIHQEVDMKAQVAFVGPQAVGEKGERDAVVVQLILHPRDAEAFRAGESIEADVITADPLGSEYFPERQPAKTE